MSNACVRGVIEIHSGGASRRGSIVLITPVMNCTPAISSWILTAERRYNDHTCWWPDWEPDPTPSADKFTWITTVIIHQSSLNIGGFQYGIARSPTFLQLTTNWPHSGYLRQTGQDSDHFRIAVHDCSSAPKPMWVTPIIDACWWTLRRPGNGTILHMPGAMWKRLVVLCRQISLFHGQIFKVHLTFVVTSDSPGCNLSIFFLPSPPPFVYKYVQVRYTHEKKKQCRPLEWPFQCRNPWYCSFVVEFTFLVWQIRRFH